jgi:hypothetical protein
MLATILRVLLAIAPPSEAPPLAERAWRMATDEVREAIDAAYLFVDPEQARPWWRAELYLICAREGRCGQYGLVGLHGNDYPLANPADDTAASLGAWLHEVDRGRLDPETCDEHSYTPREWGTRGLFGLNAARGVARLEQCVGPEALDDPATSARIAALELAACDRWVGAPGARRKVLCTCSEHTRLWMGAGVWANRSIFALRRSIERQCGRSASWIWFARKTLGLPYLLNFTGP